MAQTQHHPKKRFSEEEALEKMEKTIDQKMEKIMKQWFVHKFLDLKIMKDLFASHIVNDINHKIHTHLYTIFLVVWWITLVSGLIGIFGFLVSLSWLGFMFSLGVGIGLRVLLYVVFAFAFSLLSLLVGIGLIRFKKRVISLIVLLVFVSLLLFLVSFIPVWLYSYKSYGGIWSGIFNLIITFVLLVLVVKNQEIFKN